MGKQLYRDIVLFDKSDHSSLTSRRLTVGSTVVAAVPVCREPGFDAF